MHQWIDLILPSLDHGELLPLFPAGLYLQSLCALITIHYFTQNKHQTTWKQKLKQVNINPQTYTATWHQHKYITYIKINTLTNKVYVGETYKGIAERELTRRRKLKQLEQDRNASCELALHYWKNTNTYHKYATIVTHHVQHASLTKLQELSNISKWQPSLNPPIVQKILKTNKYIQSSSFTIRRTNTNTRMWRKLRNLGRFFHLKSTTAQQHIQLQHWRLHRLSNPSLKQFQTQKILRQPKLVTALELFALARQSQNLTEPQRSTAIKELQRIFICLFTQHLLGQEYLLIINI